MLGPKHTAREAAAILVAGLRDGSIVLRRSEDPPVQAFTANGPTVTVTPANPAASERVDPVGHGGRSNKQERA